jgi:hypothetical protein
MFDAMTVNIVSYYLPRCIDAGRRGFEGITWGVDINVSIVVRVSVRSSGKKARM